MTNRHVAEIFSLGLGEKGLRFRPSWSAAVNLRKEVVPTPDVLDLQVTEVVMVHPYWDMALLRVTGLPAGDPLSLGTAHPDDLADKDVVVIGYPAFDPRNDTDLQNRIFGGVFGVKRLQPGKVSARREIESFGNEVNALVHDASTLGGNSGSLVLDVESGEVIGLHFGGLYLDGNFAVPAYELARDTKVVDTGIRFSGAIDATSAWAPRWAAADSTDTDSVGNVGKESGLRSQPPAGNGGGGASGGGTSGTGMHAGGAAAPGGSVSVTIPLTVTVSLGQPQTPSSQVAEALSVTEGIFGGGSNNDEQILANALELSSESHIGSGSLNQMGGLTCAALSKLAYSNAHVDTEKHVKTMGFETYFPVSRNDTQCFITSNDRIVVVAFRGSESNLGDWLGNLRALRVSSRNGSVHAGFFHAFRDAHTDIENELRNVSAGSKRLVLTGHSLGGALTLIAASEWMGVFPVSEIYTFGQPAVGGKTFKRNMEELASRCARYVYKRDIVARLPPFYRHIVGKTTLPLPLQESMATLVEDDNMLTEEQFTQLQSALTGETLQEGLFDGFSDHSMINYLSELTRQTSA